MLSGLDDRINLADARYYWDIQSFSVQAGGFIEVIALAIAGVSYLKTMIC